ncbi:sigma-54 dependent transcriptional regulator [Pendulispora brunnea]|uniref:Sigma-54 dependent transcriptional regulator n=1 Tax=Pendulispora brunnea TaxID=2905690 RepID=A0ABZ2K3V7_9BACT
MSRILVVEDEPIIRGEIHRLLARHGHDVSEAGSVAEVTTERDLDAFDLVITDLRLPGAPGTDLIERAGATPVLVMTSYATVKSAVEAMKLGAADYVAKPFDHDELLLLVDRLLAQGRLQRQVAALRSDVERSFPVSGMIGRSPGMQDVFARITKVAPTDATVLIRGESGTGKELVARAIHEQSPRRDAPIVAVNCAAIPEGLIESELFGHEKGAFTGAAGTHTGLVEAAAGGTLFLDEIGELPAAAQARLLRALQEGEVRRVGATRTRRIDVRIIAATHRDLPQMVQAGQFRQDLYFRLRVVDILLPPLRDRGEDIDDLAQHLLDQAMRRLGKAGLSFTAPALSAIHDYHWPGNVRELDNAIERAVILCDTGRITPELLALDEPGTFADSASPSEDPIQTPEESAILPNGGETLEDYFRRFVVEHQDRMSETELARRLGISRKALWERRSRLGIPRSRPA